MTKERSVGIVWSARTPHANQMLVNVLINFLNFLWRN